MTTSVQKIRNENEKILEFIKKWQSNNVYNPKYQNEYNSRFNNEFENFLRTNNLSEETIKTFTNENKRNK